MKIRLISQASLLVESRGVRRVDSCQRALQPRSMVPVRRKADYGEGAPVGSG